MARPPDVGRRAALRVLGAAGAGLVLVACGGDDKKENSAKSPAETGGPYPADGTNGPNVLHDPGIVRSDLTKSFGAYSGTAAGVPLTVKLHVVRATTGAAYAGAALYLWHCDAQARYSLYSQGATDQNYCRGVQAADASGDLTFKTIFPAAYAGRYPHFHYEVFPSLSATSAGSRLLTSQIALPADACDDVYADEDSYPGSARNMAQTSLERDMVFADSYQTEVARMTGRPSSGYTLTFTAVV